MLAAAAALLCGVLALPATAQTPSVCDRTEQVRDAIVEEADVDDCAMVTVELLAGIRGGIHLSRAGITSLQSGDFAGLTSLRVLELNNNSLAPLPAGVFSGLTALIVLDLIRTEQGTLHEDVFSSLPALEVLDLDYNNLTSLPAGVFSGNRRLAELDLTGNDLRSFPAAVTGLTALEELHLGANDLSELPADAFSRLTNLRQINLRKNELTSLPAGVFSGLSELTRLNLSENELTSLPAGVFSGLSELTRLNLSENELTSLPAGVFSGLSKLIALDLEYNQLSSLPAGLLSGLTELTTLDLRYNSVDPLPLTVTVEKVGTEQARAKVLAGAPFAVDFTPTVSNGSLTTGGATVLSVAAGSVEGTPVTVERTSGTTQAVTVDVDLTIQPVLPSQHEGYEFVRARSGLPAEILPLKPPGIRNVTLVNGPGGDGVWSAGERVELEVRFAKPVVVERPACWDNGDGQCREPGPYVVVAMRDDSRPGHGSVLSTPLVPYESGSGTATLRFAYTVGAGEAGAKGVEVADGKLILRGATIRRAGVDVDSSYSRTRVMQVEVRARGSAGGWTVGETVRVAVRFAGPRQDENRDQVVVEEGTPSIGLLLGDRDRRGVSRTASYERGSGSNTLTFEYEVAARDGGVSAVEVVADSLRLNGATIRNEDGYDAELEHPGAERYSSRALRALDAEPAHEGGTLRFTMELAEASKSPVTVDYETADGTATAGEDYEAKRGTMTFTPGHTRKTIEVEVLRDEEAEDEETVSLRLSNARSEDSEAPVEVTVAQAEGTIEDVAPEAPSGGLTARFARAPAEHDGKAFTLRIAFSETIRMSGRRLRLDVVSVSGGRATKAGPVNGRKDRWNLTVRPASLADVTVTLAAGAACDTPAAVCTADGKALSNTLSTVVRGPVTVSVADARVREAAGATLDFAVSLSRAASGAVSVTWATADGSATAGSDYRAGQGKLRFAPGETEKTVAVAVLDDAHDEGEETLTLRLTAATGARIADGVATGTIENTDHMPAAWLARFGRSAATHVLDAVEARLQGGASHTWVQLGGHRIGGGAAASEALARLAPQPRLWDEVAEADPAGRDVTVNQLLLGSAFHLASNDGAASGPRLSAWGRVASSGFDGVAGDTAFDGTVTTATLGVEGVRALADGPGAGLQRRRRRLHPRCRGRRPPGQQADEPASLPTPPTG